MALSKEAREYFAKEGRRGGKARLETMTPEERKNVARKAARARWARAGKKPKRSAKSLSAQIKESIAKQKK